MHARTEPYLARGGLQRSASSGSRLLRFASLYRRAPAPGRDQAVIRLSRERDAGGTRVSHTQVSSRAGWAMDSWEQAPHTRIWATSRTPMPGDSNGDLNRYRALSRRRAAARSPRIRPRRNEIITYTTTNGRPQIATGYDARFPILCDRCTKDSRRIRECCSCFYSAPLGANDRFATSSASETIPVPASSGTDVGRGKQVQRTGRRMRRNGHGRQARLTRRSRPGRCWFLVDAAQTGFLVRARTADPRSRDAMREMTSRGTNDRSRQRFHAGQPGMTDRSRDLDSHLISRSPTLSPALTAQPPRPMEH